MHSPSQTRTGWRATALIAITYVYFLIFAQFAFLKRLAALGIADAHLKAVMAAMATGGILLSLLTPRTRLIPSPIARLRIALIACAAAALLSTAPLTLPTAISVSFLIGAALGLLTVTLVTHLPLWLGPRNPLLQVGLGTGIGYLICNLPPLFTASPQTQAVTAALLCLTGLFATFSTGPQPIPTPPTGPSFPRVLLSFTALIWLDSAAFFIIQNTPSLKSGTWQGTAHLWLNAALHLLAAIACALLLRRRNLTTVLRAALAALAAACLLLAPSHILLASVFYPIGVSLYSVALVAYPSLLAPASSLEARGKQAGWIYAIAGWIGSAMGIGMGQNLGHVPTLFVLLAATAILLPTLAIIFQKRRRELIATAVVFALAYALSLLPRSQQPFSPTEHGRQVYIAEGCIHCHSQYVRPHTPDVLRWGPIQAVEELRLQHPPLIGNRRQGPDLSQVGNRRSPLWLEAHFLNPSELNHASFMPSYAHLFTPGDSRGPDLVAYLATLHSTSDTQHRADQQAWQPSFSQADPQQGAALYQTDCATCHAPTGPTRLALQTRFHRLPPNLSTRPLLHVVPSGDRRTQLAQIVKFGLPGTDMPGHEYLPDTQIASLALWLDQLIPTSQEKAP